jgi:hypothetical protein
MAFAFDPLLVPPRRWHTVGLDFLTHLHVAPGGGPGGGCARRPVGTHHHLFVVGADNPIAVLCLARQGARRGEPKCQIPTITNYRESHVRRGFNKYFMYDNGRAKISRSGRSICFPRPETTKVPSHLGAWGLYLHGSVEASSVRTD